MTIDFTKLGSTFELEFDVIDNRPLMNKITSSEPIGFKDENGKCAFFVVVNVKYKNDDKTVRATFERILTD